MLDSPLDSAGLYDGADPTWGSLAALPGEENDPPVAVDDLAMLSPVSPGVSTDDLVFIHHSVGLGWLESGLEDALLAKEYVDERNDVYYGTDMEPDSGRPDSLDAIDKLPGDKTDTKYWLPWFNDYLGNLKDHGSADGENTIVMFKSCFHASNTHQYGTEPGDPFSELKTIPN